MELFSKVTIGNKSYQIKTDGDTLFDCVYALGGIYDIKNCGLCDSELLSLRALKTKEDYEYLKIVCGKCGAELVFGKTKKEGIMFLRRNEQGKLDWQKSKDKKQEVKKEKKSPVEEYNDSEAAHVKNDSENLPF